MLIQRVEISNFRSLKAIDLDCGALAASEDRALVALLGRNGGGKSSVLYALDVFYDVAAKLTVDDCYARNPNNEIMIRVTYGHLRDDERNEFQSYIEEDRLIVTKRITIGQRACTQKYFAAARQIPEFAECRRIGNKNDLKKKYAELAAQEKFKGLPASVRTAEVAGLEMSKFEAGHGDMLVTVEREEQFFGPKEVGGGKLDKFTKFVLVPAVRHASVEEQKKGVIHQLIDMIVLRQVNKRPDVRKLKADMKEKIEKIFSKENLTELGGLGEAISKLLGEYSPGCELQLTWGAPQVPEIPLPNAIADLVEDDFPCPISHTGHGLQRSLILTLLQYLAMVERPTDDDDETTSTEVLAEPAPTPATAPAILNPDLILAIEEPELFLHPSRCRHLSDLLLRLTKVPTEPSVPRNQIIYATHSPYFVDLHRFDQVRIARKPKNPALPAPCCVISQFSLDAAAKELARIADADPKGFTRDSFRARSLPVMTTAVNEGFFAHAVVVVEGLSEVGVFWTVQSQMGKEWGALGIAVVPALGKENIDRPVVVFRGLTIPTYFVFDGDAKFRGKADDKEKRAKAVNIRYQRMAGITPVDFPTTQSHGTWAVFEYDVEKELKDAVGTEFDSIAKKAMDELRYESSRDLMKNTEGAARLVELIYEAGKTIPVLEEIVTKITELCVPRLATSISTETEAEGEAPAGTQLDKS